MGLLAALGLGKSDGQTTAKSKPLSLAQMGAVGAMAAYLPGEILQEAMWQGEELPAFYALLAGTAIWMGVYAIGYCIALTIGQNRYLHRPWLSPQEAALNVGGGAFIGVLSGGVAQFFFSIAVAVGEGNPLFNELARIVAWAMFGGLIGLGMSFVIPNLGRLHGVAGGAAGGAIGAIGFIASGVLAGDAIGRFVGMAIVGAALGYAIGLVEEVSREAWLQVTYGNSRETVRVSLGPDRVCVGSNSNQCVVWAQGARPIALRFRYVDGKVMCDDMASERTSVVDPGFQQQVGNVHLVVCVGGSSHSPNAGQPGTPVGGFPPQQMAPRPPAPPPRPPAPPPTARPTTSATPGPVKPVLNASPLGNPQKTTGRKGPPAPPPPPPPPPKR